MLKKKHPTVGNADGRECKMMLRLFLLKQKYKKEKYALLVPKRQETVWHVDSRRAGPRDTKKLYPSLINHPG